MTPITILGAPARNTLPTLPYTSGSLLK